MARDTRLARRYLLALENESIDDLPGGVYNRAYLRTCAAYLGLDADNLVRDYDLQTQARTGSDQLAEPDAVAAMRAVVQQKALRTGGRDGVNASRGRAVLLRSVAFAVLVGGVWAGTRHFRYPSEVVAASNPPIAVASDIVVIKSVAIGAVVREPVSLAEPGSPQPHVSDQRGAPPSVSVSVSGVGTDVIDRQLVGRAESFAVGARVVFWTLVTGGRPGDTVRHVWAHRGRTVAVVDLPIGAASWRTHSHQILAPGTEGEWVVEAQDGRGRVLARHTFRTTP